VGVHFGEEHDVSFFPEFFAEGQLLRPAVFLAEDFDAVGDVFCVEVELLSLRWRVWKRIFCRNLGSSSLGVMS
jgi:hypothetical protein